MLIWMVIGGVLMIYYKYFDPYFDIYEFEYDQETIRNEIIQLKAMIKKTIELLCLDSTLKLVVFDNFVNNEIVLMRDVPYYFDVDSIPFDELFKNTRSFTISDKEKLFFFELHDIGEVIMGIKTNDKMVIDEVTKMVEENHRLHSI